MRHLRLCAAAAVLVVLAAGVAADAWAIEDWETLRGHKAMGVEVGELNDHAKALGLTKARLQTMVELRLRQAGITVAAGSWPHLFVHMFAVPVASGGTLVGYACNIRVVFIQPVLYVTDPSAADFSVVLYEELLEETPLAVASGATWDTGSLAIGALSSYPEHAEQALGKLLDTFINDWLRANPRVSPDYGTKREEDYISIVQGRLHRLGYDVGEVDGVLGPNTVGAIREFCEDQSLGDWDDFSLFGLRALIEKLAQAEAQHLKPRQPAP